MRRSNSRHPLVAGSRHRPLWIRNPLAILAEGGEGGVLLVDGRIDELVPAGTVPQTLDTGTYDEFDASEHVVLPGLVNVHHHFYQTLTRAYPDALNKALFPWLQSLYPVWAGLDEEMIALSTRLALAELLLSGCTTAADHHYLFTDALENAVDIEVEAARELGIRMTVTRGSMSLGQDDGGLPPQSVVQSGDRIMADSQRVASGFHEAGEGALIQIALAPCSPFSVTREIMRETAALARQLGVRMHTHLAETHDETDFCLAQFGMRPLDYLEDCGWLGNDVWLAHGIHFDDAEVARLGQAGVGIAHCPSSNMLLASGSCRGVELEVAGSPVGIGVDGSASNDCSNMIQEVRQALLLQKLKYGAETVDHHRVLRWATRGSAACLGRGDVGEIAIGKQADLALFKLDEPRFSGAGDPLAALVICGAVRADAVLVGGRWRVRDGDLVDVDLDRLMNDHRQAAQRLRSKADGMSVSSSLRF